MKCRNCKKIKFLKIIKIGDQPISSSTLKNKKKLKKYPLDLFKCQNCNLIQLSKVAPADKMYGNSYGYWTGLSDLMINHMKKKVEWIKKSKKILKKSRALDIGCSDPTFLKLLKKVDKSLELFAVDTSSEKFEESFKKEKINLIVDYFSKQKIDNYLEKKKLNKKNFL